MWHLTMCLYGPRKGPHKASLCSQWGKNIYCCPLEGKAWTETLCFLTSVLQDNRCIFFDSEDAFCKQCLVNAALDHPSSSGGEQVPAELPVQLPESGVAESAISQTVQTVSDSRVSCACPDAHG